jgi:dipeptidyl aminopeptidase/acylaminoacyl peptidase
MAKETNPKKDIRDGELYRQAEALYTQVRQPGSGQISDAAEVNASPDGRYAVFSGTILDALEGAPPTRICRTDLATGDTRVLTFGPNVDRLPKVSPDGTHIAFVSDRAKAGDFQLHLLDAATGAARATPRVEGWVEYLHWSPDGKRILLATAGHGADIAGGHGAVTSKQLADSVPSWVPKVETGDESFRWRHAWIYELATDSVRKIEAPQLNIWEAVWCGNERLAAVTSPGPGEGLWYAARLHLIEVRTGESRELYVPKDQIGWPNASPSGRTLALVEAVCSDRWIVAGDLLVIDTASATVQRIDTRGVDITYTEWRSDRALFLAGHRGFQTVLGIYDPARGPFWETWSGRELTIGGRYATASGFGEPGDCALLGEGFERTPELAILRDGEYQPVRSFDLGYREAGQAIDRVECVTWQASDGLEIQGWLLLPQAKPPYPLVLNVHGGPVWQWRPAWLGRLNAAPLMLLKRGYAILFPNPRGSSGRGQDFARRVVGDLGGAETTDHLSGLDQLVRQGLADPKRLGVTGGSHGGFMTSWLIGQDTRFAAAVPVAPVINWVSEHLISNIPHFCAISLDDRYTNAAGKYFTRSPLMYAHKVKTPTLNICGALDRCTPPEEAMQFHNALLENGVKSVLVTYPEEGHGVRKFPAAVDYAARVVAWFEEHMRASPLKQA